MGIGHASLILKFDNFQRDLHELRGVQVIIDLTL